MIGKESGGDMFSLMLHKLLHKKWMVLCLLIGNVLLIAIAVSYPLYRVSSFQKMLMDEFAEYEEKEQRWPAVFSVSYSVMKGGAKTDSAAIEEEAFRAVKELKVEVLETVISYRLATQKATPSVIRDDNTVKRISLAAVSGLEEHVEVVYGRLPDDEPDSQGCLEVMVSDAAMLKQDILLEDEYTYELNTYSDGSPVKLKVVGVFRPLEETERYWEIAGEDMDGQVYATEAAFRQLFLGEETESRYTLSQNWDFIWDYNALETPDVTRILRTMNQMEKSGDLKDRIDDSGYQKILTDYSAKARRIEATLLILQVPVLLLLCAFLYMISGQMLGMERNEISLLRSRGSSRRQVFMLYLMQSVFLSIISLLVGIPLGTIFCKMLGSSTTFLEFSAARSLPVHFTPDVLPYGAGAVLLSIVMTTIPVLSYSGVSIVKLKQNRSRQKKSLWKKLYLDVIFLAVSLYGFYSFSRSSEQIVKDVLAGNAMDPLLYISFSLFILGAGLFCARLQPILLKGFFALFKNHIKPAAYASVIGAIRTGAKQEFIILFLILTVSIGISDTMIARTIVLNAVNNTRHIVGADITLKERWDNNGASILRDPSQQFVYTEADFDKYQTIPGVETATPVLLDEDGAAKGKSSVDATIMGIRAQGFYQVTTMEEGLLPYSYADYLNVLSADTQAVVVSENFMIKQGYQLGDIITYTNGKGGDAVGYIYGFFQYWPGYQPQSYSSNEDGSTEITDNYMIVANYPYLKEKWGSYPYEVWMDVSDDGKGFYEWIETLPSLTLTKLQDMKVLEEEIMQDTMFQGTNGILSMSFIVILLLCCVGYLIYWILSIRSRELLFGVLRAMGMRKGEITWLLMIEQICSGLYAIVTGGLIGMLASRMFVPMIQQAYAASEQVLPLRLITETSDLVKLFVVIGAVLCICLIVLGRIVSRMNISSALKLGED